MNELSAEDVQAVRRRLNYVQIERLGKMSPNRPGAKYDIAEARAFSNVLELLAPRKIPYIEYTDHEPLEEPPRLDEVPGWHPGGGVPKPGKRGPQLRRR